MSVHSQSSGLQKVAWTSAMVERYALEAVHRGVGYELGHDAISRDRRQCASALRAGLFAIAQLLHALAAEAKAAVVIRMCLRLVQRMCTHRADELFVQWRYELELGLQMGKGGHAGCGHARSRSASATRRQS